MTGVPKPHSMPLIVALLTCACALDGVAQQSQNRPGRGGLMGGGMMAFAGGPVELLRREDVQSELELLEEQKQAARALTSKLNDRRRELFTEIAGQFRREGGDLDRETMRQRMQETLQALNDEVEEGLHFLLPHQRDRLRQLELQWRMRGSGLLGTFADRGVLQTLELTEDQQAKLREKSRSLQQELNERIAALRRETQDRLLAELTTQQQARFKELVGEPFEFHFEVPRFGEGPSPQSPESD